MKIEQIKKVVREALRIKYDKATGGDWIVFDDFGNDPKGKTVLLPVDWEKRLEKKLKRP